MKKNTAKDDLCVVYSLALMNDIVMAGHRCKQVEDDNNNPRFKVFLFDNKPEVQEIIKNYMSRNKTKR